MLQNFYSIGPDCCQKFRLGWKKRIENIEIKETQFFDYLMSNIDTFISILETKDIKSFFNIDNVTIYGYSEDSKILLVRLKNIYVDSIHDVNYSMSNRSILIYLKISNMI